MSSLSNNTIFQTAWVVPDIEAAAMDWAATRGVGPFYLLEFEGGDALQYRGGPGEIRMRVALAQAGDVQVELIQPLSATPNIYRDLVPEGETRFHHICFWSEDLPADISVLNAAGFPLAMVDDPVSPSFAYCDSSATNGHMIELVSRREDMEQLFAGIAQQAIGWDGLRPVREVADLMA